MNFLSEITGSFAQPCAENPTVAIVEAAYRHHGLDWRYLNCEIAPEGSGRRRARCAGHALGRFQLLAAAQGGGHRISRRTRRIGRHHRRGQLRRAAPNGKMIGENTDGKGFVQVAAPVD